MMLDPDKNIKIGDKVYHFYIEFDENLHTPIVKQEPKLFRVTKVPIEKKLGSMSISKTVLYDNVDLEEIDPNKPIESLEKRSIKRYRRDRFSNSKEEIIKWWNGELQRELGYLDMDIDEIEERKKQLKELTL